VTVDWRHTEPDALRELREARLHRTALSLVRGRLEHALELLAVDAIDDGIELVAETLRLLEVETR
jgi:hypothetical protein